MPVRVGQALQEVPRQAQDGLSRPFPYVVLLVAGALALGGSCIESEPFECETDAQCNLDGEPGRCQETGYCAYEDEECPSGLRYSLDSPEELAGECTE